MKTGQSAALTTTIKDTPKERRNKTAVVVRHFWVYFFEKEGNNFQTSYSKVAVATLPVQLFKYRMTKNCFFSSIFIR